MQSVWWVRRSLTDLTVQDIEILVGDSAASWAVRDGIRTQASAGNSTTRHFEVSFRLNLI